MEKVFLTFDDGPHEKYTPKILDILKRFEAKACFFLVGKKAKKYPHIVRRIYREGHDIGNHTYTHPVSPIFDFERMEKEIDLTDRTIRKIVGYKPKFFRPTWSRWNMHSKSMSMIAKRLGHLPVRWSVSSIDWLGMKALIRYKILMRKINNGDIFLFHDGAEKAFFSKREATVSFLPDVLQILRKNNILPLRLSELSQL